MSNTRIPEDNLGNALCDSHIAISTQDRDLRYEWMHNPGLVFGPCDPIGLRDSELLPAEEATRLGEIKRRTLDRGEPAKGIVRIETSEGEAQFHVVVEPIRDDFGQVNGITTIITDVSELQISDTRWHFERAVLTSIRDSVIVTSLDGEIVYWNNGATETFGYTAEEMLGKTPALLYPHDDAQELAADLATILAGDDFHGEWQGQHKDGSTVWVEIKTSLVYDGDGHQIGFAGISKDITRRKRAEQERDSLLAWEQRTRHGLRRFLALVAHDLHQPLTAILGHTQRLQRGRVDPSSPRYTQTLQSIASSGTQMRRLIDDLSDAATIGEGRFMTRPVASDLVVIVREAVEDCQATTDRHRIRAVTPDELRAVWDAQRLGQMLRNLLGNAIKYSPDGGIITVTLTRSAHEALIAVEDHGTGIPESRIPELFDLFTRANDDETVSGLGLGLYICRAIVNAHGGRIWAESTPGVGSTFFVALPLRGGT